MAAEAGLGLFAFGGFLGFAIVWFIIGIIAFLWALIDIAKAKKDTGWKIIWVIICLLLGIIGVIIYYFVEKRKK